MARPSKAAAAPPTQTLVTRKVRKRHVLYLSMDEGAKAKVAALAAEDGISVGVWARRLILRAIGLLPGAR